MAIINREDQDTTLTITTNGELLINFGDLTTTADLEDGIFAGANDVKIRHFGSIETSGLGAAGIFVQGNDARIENHGSVVTHGDSLATSSSSPKASLPSEIDSTSSITAAFRSRASARLPWSASAMTA